MSMIDWEVNPCSDEHEIECNSCGKKIKTGKLYLFRDDRDHVLCKKCGLIEVEDAISELEELEETLRQ